jgi:hypothetical protein
VVSRRSVLFAPGAFAFAPLASAQRRPPDILVIWSAFPGTPAQIARQSLVFPRAYAACPKPDLARRALETGKFPHAIRPGDATLPLRQLTARSPDEAVRMAGSVGPGTIVVLTSAGGNGEDSPRESAIRVPLAVQYPGMIVPRYAPEVLISHVDLMPTLLSLGGVPVPKGVQGRDLVQFFTGKKFETPDSVYIEGKLGQPDSWRVVIRGFDKAVLNLQEEVTELYNLADDPGERANLVREPAQELTRDAMLALARVWMRRLADGRDSSGAKLRR